MGRQIVNPNNARTDKYQKELNEIARSGKCPFCSGGHALVNAKRLPIWENEYWIIKPNDYDIAGTLLHLVLISRRHVETLDELTEQEWLSLREAHQWMRNTYGSDEAIFAVREGDTNATGATVCHLHWQYYVPKFGEAIELRYGPPPKK